MLDLYTTTFLVYPLLTVVNYYQHLYHRHYMAILQPFALPITFNTHTHTTIVQLSGLCPGQPEGTFHHILDFLVQKMKITRTDAPAIQMDCHPIQTNLCPISAIATIFTPYALPGTTLPIYPGLGQAPYMLAYIPSGLVYL